MAVSYKYGNKLSIIIQREEFFFTIGEPTAFSETLIQIIASSVAHQRSSKYKLYAYILIICTFYVVYQLFLWGTRWRSWLRHCATSRKVAGSIPDGVIGIFR